MIHKVAEGFVISAQNVWRPGVYDTERTATYATRFKDEVLQRLQDSKGGSVITYADLKAAQIAANCAEGEKK